MGIQGSLETVGLPDVLQLVSSGSMTGTLVISREGETRRLFFQDGSLLHATSSSDRYRLLDRLVKSGGLTFEQAEQVRRTSGRGKLPLIQRLIQAELVPSDQLMAAVAESARDIVYELFQWLDGEFEFREGELPGEDMSAFSASLATYNLIMEGARRIDEWSRIRSAIPSMSLLVEPRLDPTEAGVTLVPGEKKVLGQVNGCRTVREICQAVGKPEFETCRVLYGLLSSGLIQTGGVRGSPAKATSKKPSWWTPRNFAFLGGGLAGLALVISALVVAVREPAPSQADPPMTLAVATQAEDLPPPPATVPTEEASTEAPAGSPVEPAAVGATVQDTPAEPTRVPEPTPVPPRPPVPSRDGRIDINTASSAELQALPRVGPATAAKIIAYRTEHGPFGSPYDITRVAGIGEKTYQRMADQITVGGGGSAPPPASRGRSAPAPAPKAKPVPSGARVNINTASSAELQVLPRVGPATAAKIIAYRTEHGPFRNPHDIIQVAGIGEKTYQRMADRITVE